MQELVVILWETMNALAEVASPAKTARPTCLLPLLALSSLGLYHGVMYKGVIMGEPAIRIRSRLIVYARSGIVVNAVKPVWEKAMFRRYFACAFNQSQKP